MLHLMSYHLKGNWDNIDFLTVNGVYGAPMKTLLLLFYPQLNIEIMGQGRINITYIYLVFLAC